MKRLCGFLIAVLLLCVFASKDWFGQKHAAPMADASVKPVAAIHNNRKELQKQEAFSADSLVENALQEEAAQKNVSMDGREEAFRVTLLSAVPGRTRFRFELNDFAISEESENGKTYSCVQLGEAWESAEKGKPALPVIRRDFVVAKGRKANLRIISVQEDKVVCAPPKPSVGILPRTAEIPAVEEDASVYGGNGVYPPEAVATGERYVIRGAAGMSLSIHPMRYDFHNGAMLVMRSFEAEITEDDALAEEYAMLDDEWNFRKILERRYMNGNLLRGTETSEERIGQLLIIAPDNWLASLSDFVAWKERLGYGVTVAGYPSMTGDGSDGIASFIRAAYQGNNVSHVILCGDRNDVPPAEISRFPNSPGVSSPTTDTPYSWVDGDDQYADLFLSRMSVTSASELLAVCAKIQAYEQSETTDGWRNVGLFIGSAESGTAGVSKNRTDSSLLEEERAKLLDSNVFEVTNTLFATEQSVTAQGISNQLIVGYSLVYYLGHGKSDRWTTGNFESGHATTLQNGDALPFVASFCCSTANFAYKQTCLGEAFLRNQQGGAVCFLGATSETYWNPPIYAMRQMTGDIQNRYDAGRLTCLGAYSGVAVMAGIDYILVADKLEGAGTSDYFAKQMTLLGDCSTMGRIGGGRKAVIAIKRSDLDSYRVTVTWEDTGEPVQGAAVCARNADGTARLAIRSDENGQVVVKAFARKTIVVVSDAGWGCHEEVVDAAVAMDTDLDGMISNTEAIAYLNTVGQSLTDDDLVSVREAWERGGPMDMSSRMPSSALRVDVAENVVKEEVMDDASAREPGSDIEPVPGTRTPMEYWSIEALNRRIEQLCVEHPEICREEYVGRSMDGREIIALRISMLESSSNCPDYLIAAGIHGNERISTWVAMRLAEEIIADLERGESVYRPLLSTCALWIVPSMNPDGASTKTPSRQNANNHDLNRSFPDGALQMLGTWANGDSMMTYQNVPVLNNMQGIDTFLASDVPEVTTFMRFSMSHSFKAALHLHSGDLLVSYPYGNNAERKKRYEAAPHDAQFKELAEAYCNAYDGTLTSINSCNWYPVNGEAPDWQYRYLGTLPLTVELVEKKEPTTLESCEFVWAKHEHCFAAWLAACLDIAEDTEVVENDVTIYPAFKRLMPFEIGRLTVEAKAENGAMVLNMACESGLEPAGMDGEAACVIGMRTESDGSTSWLLYRRETSEDESFGLDVKTTDTDECKDHVVSFATLSQAGERLVFRRQLLLAEKRNFEWELLSGWNFISSPIQGESIMAGDDCFASHWNGKGYTKEKMLEANDFRPCKALWVHSSEVKRLQVAGRMGTETPVLRPGWNVVGSLYSQMVDGECFTVEGQSSVFSNEMLPGIGYWIFVK